ncbi:MAG: fatty acid desaturase [Pseudomonadota bacterium]
MAPPDHRSVLAALPAETRVALTARSDLAGLGQGAFHLLVVSAMGVWIALGLPLWWALIWPQGVALAFLFTAQHEATHRTPFARPWLNDAMGHAAGLVLFQPFLWFRAFHMAHHKFTGDPDRDPELATPRPRTRAELAWTLLGIGYWTMKAQVLWRNASGRNVDTYVPPGQRPRIAVEARLYLSIYAALALMVLTPGVGTVLLWTWLIPLATGFPVLRLYLLAEHDDCPNVPNMFENTRTTFTDRLTRRLAWNMPYHAEHHAWPAVPFHRLPAFHDLARAHLQVTSPSYRAFTKDYLRSL